MGLITTHPRTQVARCETVHARKDGPSNRFRYKINYLLVPMLDADHATSRFFSRNRTNVLALHDADHGAGQGRSMDWVLEWSNRFGLPGDAIAGVWLLTQPRTFGYVFNPVSFWLMARADGELIAVLVEVNNTFGDRHSYFCANDNFVPINAGDKIKSRKVFHVSPFQDIVGDYTFRFDIRHDRFGIWIDYARPDKGGLFTSLTGNFAPMTNRNAAAMLIRKPFGAARVMLLIHWQALKLTLRRAGFRPRPQVPEEDVTR